MSAAWDPLADPAIETHAAVHGSSVRSGSALDASDANVHADDEDAALAALCGSLGLSLLLQKGSPAELKDWIARATAKGLGDADVAPARERLEQLARDRAAAKGSTGADLAPARERPSLQKLKSLPPMDDQTKRLTEQAWELRTSGERCLEAKDAAQAVRYFEWALDLLQPVQVEHAGPTRCALLMSLARCHLQGSRELPPDPSRALRCCEQVKENDPHSIWEANTKQLKEQAQAMLGTAKPGPKPVDSARTQATTARLESAQRQPAQISRQGKTVYCLELNSVQTFNMLDTTLTDDIMFALDAIKQDRMRRSG